MNTKIIRKVASILMVLVIMSSTLSDPIMNIGKVIAEAYDSTAEPTDDITAETETAQSDVATTPISDDTVTPAEVENTDISTEISDSTADDATVPESTSTDIGKIEPSSSEVPKDTEQPVSNSTSSSPSTNQSVSINPTANDPPYPGLPYFDQNSGPYCGPIQDNAGAPKFHGITQYNADQGNFLRVSYNGGSDGIPQGYAATYVTFYDPNESGSESPDTIAYGPVELNAPDPTWDFIATSPASTEKFMNIEIDPEHLPVVLNLLNNGQVTLKYVVTYEKPSANGTATGDCIRKVSNAAHTIDFVPFIKKPTFTATQSCQTDCDVNLTLNFTGSDYSSHSRYVVKRYTGSTATGTATTIVDQEIINSGLNTINLTDETIPSPGGTYTYQFYIDLYGVNSDLYNPYASPNATLTVSDKPTGSITNVIKQGSSSFEVHYNTDFKNYSVGSNTIHAYIEMYRVTPGSPEILTKVATSSDITTNATGGTSFRNFDGSAYGPGTYRFKLVVDYGTKVGTEFPCHLSAFSSDFRIYGQPTITASQTCLENCIINLDINYNLDEFESNSNVYIKRSGLAQPLVSFPINATSGLPTGVTRVGEGHYTYAYDLTNVANQNNPYTYSISIGTADVGSNPIGTTANPIALKVKPTASFGAITKVANGNQDNITVAYSINANDYANQITNVRIELLLNGNVYKTIDPASLNGPATFLDVAPGVYTLRLVGTYNEANCIFTTTGAVTVFPHPTIVASQTCLEDCMINLALTYDPQAYPNGSDMIVTRDVNGTISTLINYDINEIANLAPNQLPAGLTRIDATHYKFAYSVPKDANLYVNSTYTAHIDLTGVDSSFDVFASDAEALKEKPIATLGAITKVANGNQDNITVAYSIDPNDYTNQITNVKVDLLLNGNVYKTIDPATLNGPATFLNVAPGSYTVRLTGTYNDANCTFIDTGAVTVYPHPTIVASQTCLEDCIINLALTYDPFAYPDGSDMIVTRDVNGVNSTLINYDIRQIANLADNQLPVGLSRIDATHYKFAYSVPKDANLYVDSTYTAHIDLTGVDSSFDVFATDNEALKEKPTATIDTITKVANGNQDNITVAYSIDPNNYTNQITNIKVDLLLNGNVYKTIDPATINGPVTFLDVAPGVYTVRLTGTYNDANCIFIANGAVTVYPHPAIVASQTCLEDCIINLALTYNPLAYPDGSDMIVTRNVNGINTTIINYDINQIANLAPNQLPAGLTRIDATHYNFAYSVPKDANLYVNSIYTAHIDLTGVDSSFDVFATDNEALKEKPTATIDTITKVANGNQDNITVAYSIDQKDYANQITNIKVDLLLNGNVYKTIDNASINGPVTFLDVAPGIYTVRLTGTYNDANCIFIANGAVTAYPHPTIVASQTCLEDCIINLALTYDPQAYPDGSDMIVTRNVNGTDSTLINYDIHQIANLAPNQLPVGLTRIDATHYKFAYSVPKDANLYADSTYTAYIDLAGVDSSFDVFASDSEALKEKPTATIGTITKVANGSQDDITVEYSIIPNDYDGQITNVKVELLLNGNVYKTINPATINGPATFLNVAPGIYTVRLTGTYNNDNCIFIANGAVTVYPHPTIVASQTCLEDCIINLTLTYDPQAYPDGSDMIITRDVNGTNSTLINYDIRQIANLADNQLPLGLTRIDATHYKYAYSVPKDANLYTDSTYTAHIDLAGVGSSFDVFATDSEALKEKPTATVDAITKVADGDQDNLIVAYSIDQNDYNSQITNVKVDLLLNGNVYKTINNAPINGPVTFLDVAPGNYTLRLTGTYNNDNCTFIANGAVTVYPHPSVVASQTCLEDCIINLALTYNPQAYPSGSDITITRSVNGVNTTLISYDITQIANLADNQLPTGLTRIDTTHYKYAYSVPKDANLYADSTYYVHIDLEGVNSSFDVYANDSEALKEKPIATIGAITKVANGDQDNVVVNYSIDPNDYTNQITNVKVDLLLNGNAYKTIDPATINGPVTFLDVAPGNYTVRLTGTYNNDNCIFIANGAVTVYPHPTIVASQTCLEDCIINLALSYNPQDYPEGSDMIVTRDGVVDPLISYDIHEIAALADNNLPDGLTRIDDTHYNFAYSVPKDANLYADSTYTAHIDLEGIDSSFDVFAADSEALKEKPTATFGAITEVIENAKENMSVNYSFVENDYAGEITNVKIEMLLNGNVYRTEDTVSLTGPITLKDVAPGTYTLRLIATYNDANCIYIATSRSVTVYPDPEIMASQTCLEDCIINLALTYNPQDYPEGSDMIVTRNGVVDPLISYDIYEIATLAGDNLPAGLTRIDATHYNFAYSVPKDENLYADSTYTAHIDLEGVDPSFDVFATDTEALKEKPVLSLGDINRINNGDDISIAYSFVANEYIGQVTSAQIELLNSDDSVYASQFVTLDGASVNDSAIFEGVAPGTYSFRMTIVYNEDNCMITKTSNEFTVYEHPTIEATQDCNKECIIDVTLGYDSTNYPEDSDVVILQDGEVEVLRYMISDATHKVTGEDLYNYELTIEDFLPHTYTVYIDTKLADEFDPYSEDIEFEVLQKPDLGDITTTVVGSDQIDVDFTANLYNSGAQVSVQIDGGDLKTPLLDGDGYHYSFKDVDYGPHEVKVIISYTRDRIKCNDIFKTSDVAIPYPTINILASQMCGKECIVELTFDYDASDYPEGSKLVLLKDGEFVEAFDLGVLNTSLLLEADIFDDHDYSFYIDTNPIVVEENPEMLGLMATASVTYERDSFETLSNIEHFTLQQRPDVSNVSATLDSFDRVNIDADIDLHNSGARVFIQLDNGPIRDVTDLIGSGKLHDVLNGLTPGEHDIYLTIEYTRMGLDCPNLQEHVAITVNALETPTIEASQDCNKDCIVDLTFGYDAAAYPENSDVVVLQDGEEVLRYMISDDSHKVDGANLYNYELTVNDFLSHNYSVYIDTKLADEFDAYSEEIDFRLFEKPEIETFEMMKNEDNTITIDYKAILHDYADATGMIVITGPDGYSKTINIDSMDLSSGSITIDQLAAGTYNATFTINFGEDCKPIVLDATPVKIEPKLVYTGLENNLFEKIIIEIKEIFVNAA